MNSYWADSGRKKRLLELLQGRERVDPGGQIGKLQRGGRGSGLPKVVLSGLSALKNLYLRQKSSFLVFKLTSHIGLHPWLSGKESACNAGDTAGSISGSGRSLGKGNSHPLQNSCLEKFHGQRSLVGTVHRIAKSQRQLNDYTKQLEARIIVSLLFTRYS